MNKKIKEKLKDFMDGDEEALIGFETEVDERQRQIKEENMIARTNKDGEVDELPVVEDADEIVEGEEQVLEIDLDEELDAEIRKRAGDEAKSVIAPLQEAINDLKENYETYIKKQEEEIKQLRAELKEIKDFTDTVEDIVDTETPIGRVRRTYKLGRPSANNPVETGNDKEKEYNDTVEMRNERFKNRVQAKQ